MEKLKAVVSGADAESCVSMEGLVLYPGSDVLTPSGDLLFGTAYGSYFLYLHTRVNIKEICNKLHIEMEDLDECKIKFKCRIAEVKECQVLSMGKEALSTVLKDGSSYTVPLSLFKTNNALPEEIEFYLGADEAGTTDEVLSIEILVDYSEKTILESIRITNPPDKTQYYEGDTFDRTGMIVTADYNDGTSKSVTGYTCFPQGILTKAIQSVEIRYIENGVEKSAAVSVEVLEKKVMIGISVVNPPLKTVYEQGEYFDKKGMIIQAQYTDGTTVTVSDYSITPSGKLTYADSCITVTVRDGERFLTAVQPVTIQYFVTQTKDIRGDSCLSLSYYAVDQVGYTPVKYSDREIMLGDQGIYILTGKCTLRIKDMCLTTGVTKERLLLDGLKIEMRSADNNVPRYNLFDEAHNLISSCSTVKQGDAFLYTIPVKPFLNNEIPDSVTVSIEPAELFNQTTLLMPETANVHVEYRREMSSDADTLPVSEESRAANDCGSNPKVNLVTGKLSFISPDLTVGSDLFAIDVAHIYNSAVTGAYEKLGIGIGKGWKLNVQQYIRTASGGDYTYIDAMGTSHTFTQFGQVSYKNTPISVYNDTEGLNMSLLYPFPLNGKKYFLLKDSSENFTAFDESGKIALYMRAPVNFMDVELDRGNAVVFEYDQEKLIKIYNQRSFYSGKEAPYFISLQYDAQDRLVSLSACQNTAETPNKTISYIYDSAGDLAEIRKTVGKYTKTIKKFTYHSRSLLASADDPDTKNAIRFSYAEKDRVDKYASGYIADTGAFMEKSFFRFQYEPYETIMENEKQVALSYFYNRNGEITCAFEKSKTYPDRLISLEKDTGKYMDGSKTQATRSINGRPIFKRTNGQFDYANSFTPAREGESENLHFLLTGYVNLSEFRENATSIKAIVDFKNDGTDCRYFARVDSDAAGAWQKVTVPLSIRKKNTPITDFWFGICDNDGNFVPFEHTPFSFVPCSDTHVILHDEANASAEMYLDLLDVMNVTRSDVGFYPIEVLQYRKIRDKNAPFEGTTFMTYADLVETSKEFYLKDTNRYANLHACGGRYRLANINELEFRYTAYPNFRFPLYDKTTGECLFHLRQKSPDDQTVTSTYMKFTQKGVLTTTEVKANGKKSSTTTMASFDGRVLYTQDAYGVRDDYYYDTYGNLLRIVRKAEGGTQAMTLKEIHYDGNGEYATETIEGMSAADLTYKKPFGVVDKITRKNYDFNTDTASLTEINTRQIYDNYQERITGFLYGKGSDVCLRNEINYKNGRISSVGDGVSRYTASYDLENDEITYSYLDGGFFREMHKRKIEYLPASKETIYTDEYMNGDHTDVVTATADEYGKIKYVGLTGFGDTEYEYTDRFGGSNAEFPVSKIYDTHEMREYEFTYDHDGQLAGWNTKDDFLSVRQIGSASTKYTFKNNEKYKSEVVYDPEITTQSRVVRTVYYSDNDNNAKDNWTDMNATDVKYLYDSLGRVTKKYYTKSNKIGGYTYEYLSSGNRTSPLLTKQTYEASGMSKIVSEYNYDRRGNLISAKDRKTSNHSYGETDYLHEKEYTYDDFGRITEEYTEIDGYTDLYKKYEYLSDVYGSRRLWKVIDPVEPAQNKIYSLNGRGLIGSYTIGNKVYSYTYDNYGNVKNKKSGNDIYSCEYSRGNLLSRLKMGGKNFDYDYNHKNVRYKKVADGVTTYFYLDGSKILGEDRSDGKQLRYFYDQDGLCAFTLNGTEYSYVRDGLGNIVGITNQIHSFAANYTYDLYGNTKVLDAAGKVNTSSDFIGNINPFRWKSYYFDAESGFYNANGRYYEPELGAYIDALEADFITENPYSLFGLDRNGIACLNALLMVPYLQTIWTTLSLYSDPLYDPDAGKSWWDKHFVEVFLSAMQIVAGLIMLATGNGFAVLMLLSGVAGMFGALVGEQIAGAAGSLVNGIQAIVTGTRLASCCPLGAAVGFASGIACVAFSSAEAQESAGFGNWVKDAGLSDGWYTGLMLTANAAATAVNIVGPKCFKEGTLVKTKDGDKKIEEIEVGDEVWSYNEETGESCWKPVVRLFRNATSSWICTEVEVDGKSETIKSTEEHPYYVLNAGRDRSIIRFEGRDEKDFKGQWIGAKSLKVGDICLLSSGKTATIKKLEVEHLSEPDTTYNFEVADFHTYYVGEQGILVHNFCEKQYADYGVKYKENGKTYKAYHQADGPHKGSFIAKDNFGHGGSKFKLLNEVGGSKLKLVGDLDVNGLLMSKHSSNLGNLYSYFGRFSL